MKERWVDEGCKSIWFKEDKEEGVIIPDNRDIDSEKRTNRKTKGLHKPPQIKSNESLAVNSVMLICCLWSKSDPVIGLSKHYRLKEKNCKCAVVF